MTSILLGADEAAVSNGSMSPNRVGFQSFVAASSGYMSGFRIKSGSTVNVKTAIYADNAGTPGTLLSEGASVAIVAGWNEIAFPFIGIVAGNTYWLAFNSDAGQIRMFVGAGAMKYKDLAYATSFPNPPTGLTDFTGGFLIAGWGFSKSIPPVYDRTSLDVTNRTSKGFFNVADWTRIYENSFIANVCAAALIGGAIAFDTIATPTVTTVPSVSDLNKLIGNIDRVRAALVPYITGMNVLKYNWTEGNTPSPSMIDVNLWERTIADILNYFTKRHLRSGLSIAGVGMTRNNKWRH